MSEREPSCIKSNRLRAQLSTLEESAFSIEEASKKLGLAWRRFNPSSDSGDHVLIVRWIVHASMQVGGRVCLSGSLFSLVVLVTVRSRRRLTF